MLAPNVSTSTAQVTDPYKFKVYATTNTTITSGATTKVILNAKEFDTGSNFDATTNYRFTVPVAGCYLLAATVDISAAGMGGTGSGSAWLYKNGTPYKRGQFIAGSGDSRTHPTSQITVIAQLAANDYIELYAYNGDTATRTTGGTADSTYMSGMLVSAS